MDYLRENLDLEHEKLYSDAELEKKDNQVYMKFRSENCEKEMSATQAMGLMLTYDSFCIVNQSGLSSDWMLTYMAQENLHSALEQMPTMYAVGIRRSWDAGSPMVPFLRRGSPARDAVGFRSSVGVVRAPVAGLRDLGMLRSVEDGVRVEQAGAAVLPGARFGLHELERVPGEREACGRS